MWCDLKNGRYTKSEDGKILGSMLLWWSMTCHFQKQYYNWMGRWKKGNFEKSAFREKRKRRIWTFIVHEQVNRWTWNFQKTKVVSSTTFFRQQRFERSICVLGKERKRNCPSSIDFFPSLWTYFSNRKCLVCWNIIM